MRFSSKTVMLRKVLRRIQMNQNKNKAKDSLKATIKKMVPAVFTAFIATGIGFVALYTSPVPMIQDFGKMLTIGLIISFILGIFLLNTTLYVRDYFIRNVKKKQHKQQRKERTTKVDKVLDWIMNHVIRFRWMIIIIAVIAAAFGIWVDVDADAETDVETFMPQDTQELKDTHQLRDIMGTTDQVSIVYESDDVISDQVITWVDDITEKLWTEFSDVVVETNSVTNDVKKMKDEELPDREVFREQIADIPENQLKLFLNESQTKGVITVGIKHLEAEELKLFIDDLGLYLDNNALGAVETTITEIGRASCRERA